MGRNVADDIVPERLSRDLLPPVPSDLQYEAATEGISGMDVRPNSAVGLEGATGKK